MPTVLMNADILAGNAARQWLLAVKRVVSYCVKRSTSGKEPLLCQRSAFFVTVAVTQSIFFMV